MIKGIGFNCSSPTLCRGIIGSSRPGPKFEIHQANPLVAEQRVILNRRPSAFAYGGREPAGRGSAGGRAERCGPPRPCTAGGGRTPWPVLQTKLGKLVVSQRKKRLLKQYRRQNVTTQVLFIFLKRKTCGYLPVIGR